MMKKLLALKNIFATLRKGISSAKAAATIAPLLYVNKTFIMTQLPLIDLIVFLVYMLGIILFGASFYFKKRSASDYVSGGGNLPSWAIGMSIFATFVSSISFLALPG